MSLEGMDRAGCETAMDPSLNTTQGAFLLIRRENRGAW